MDWIAEGLSSLGLFIAPCLEGREPREQALDTFLQRFAGRAPPAPAAQAEATVVAPTNELLPVFLEEALEVLRNIGAALATCTAQPENLEALSRLVDVRLRRGRAAEASRVAAEAVRRFPDSPERHALVGETALAERRYGDAVRAFEAALAIAPESASVRVELARAELLQRHADAALRAIDTLSTRDAEMLRGAAYSQKADWPRAADAYQRAAGMSSPTIELLNALGNAQLEAGRVDEAAATLQRSLSMKTDQPEIRALLERARRRISK
jgi:tetratricopeptide (TPR) repeat protein